MANINWIRIGKEIAQTPGGAATLRILQANGVTQLVRYNSEHKCENLCSVEMIMDYAHREKWDGK